MILNIHALPLGLAFVFPLFNNFDSKDILNVSISITFLLINKNKPGILNFKQILVAKHSLFLVDLYICCFNALLISL